MSPRSCRVPPYKSLLRKASPCGSVCKAVVVMNNLLMTSLGEPPGAELSRWRQGGRRTELWVG